MFDIGASGATASTWNRPNQAHSSTPDAPSCIRIYTESDDSPRGTLIFQHPFRPEVLHRLPALQEYVDHSGRDVLLPPAGPQCAINDDILYDALKAALNPDPTLGFRLNVAEHAMSYIQTHVVLTLLGLKNEARILQDRLWVLLGNVEVPSTTVAWIWETFRGAYDANKDDGNVYMPPFSELYVEAMAWQIVNLKKIGKLDKHVEEYLECDEMGFEEPCLRDVVEERERKYGTEMGWKGDTQVQDKPETVEKVKEEEKAGKDGKENALAKALSSQRTVTICGSGTTKYSAPKRRANKEKQKPAPEPPRPSLNLGRATSGYSATSFFSENNVPVKNIVSDDEEDTDDGNVPVLRTPVREPGFRSRFGKTLGVGLGQTGMNGKNGWGASNQSSSSLLNTKNGNVGFGFGTPLDPTPNKIQSATGNGRKFAARTENQTSIIGASKPKTNMGTMFGTRTGATATSLAPATSANLFGRETKITNALLGKPTMSKGSFFSATGNSSFFSGQARSTASSFSGSTVASSFGIPSAGVAGASTTATAKRGGLFGASPKTPITSNVGSNDDDGGSSPMSVASPSTTPPKPNTGQGSVNTVGGESQATPGSGFAFQGSANGQLSGLNFERAFTGAGNAAPTRRVLKPKGNLVRMKK